MKLIIIALLASWLLTGCTTALKSIEVLNRPEPKTPLNIDLPDAVKLTDVEWVIITEDNAEEVWNKLKDADKDVVLFALDQEGYEIISKNFAEIRTAISKHRNIIIAYKDYYESPHLEDEEDK